MSSKKSYIVKDGNTLRVREGKRNVYKAPGEEVKLTDEEAEQLASVVRPKTHLDNQDGDSGSGSDGGKGNTKTKPKKPEAVTKAITGVTTAMMKEDPDRKNESWWLSDSGAPEVSALEERLGWGVSAEERDAAWEQFKNQ